MHTYSLSTRRGAGPLYRQLCDAVRADIRSGRIAPGEKLPSKRSFAAQLAVSILTVETAYAQLLSEGWIVSRPKSGYFAAEFSEAPVPLQRATRRMARGVGMGESKVAVSGVAETGRTRAASACTNVALSGGDGEDFFPFSVWARLVRRLLSRRRAALLAPTPAQGALELREAIAAHLREFRGMDIDPESVFVAAGSETLYAMLVRVLGTSGPWAIENPGHRTIATVYRQCGAEVKTIPVDAYGMVPSALSSSGALVAHMSPAHQYPTGAVAPAARRYEWLAWAAAGEGRAIVEDDYDSELRVSGLPIPTLQSLDASGRVVHLETFSRALAPTLRVGCMVVSEPLLPRFRAVFAPLSCTVPNIVQFAMADFLAEGHFARHLARTRTRCRRVRAELLAALRDGPLAGRADVSEAQAGPHLTLRFHSRVPESSDLERAAATGLRLRPLASLYDGTVPRAAASSLLLDYVSLAPGRAAVAVAALSGIPNRRSTKK